MRPKSELRHKLTLYYFLHLVSLPRQGEAIATFIPPIYVIGISLRKSIYHLYRRTIYYFNCRVNLIRVDHS